MNVYTIDEIKELVKPIAKDYGIDTVYLFGSYARGDATEDSDIDFLIKGFKCDRPWAYPGLFVTLEEILQKKVDIIEAEALNETLGKERLWEKELKINIKKERILIYENQ